MKYYIIFILFARFSYQATANNQPLPNSKQITSLLKMSWEFDGNDIIIEIHKSGAGHAVIGIGTDMHDGDVIKFVKSGGSITATDCYLGGDAAPVCTETQSITELVQSSNGNSFTYRYRRAKNTGDVKDQIYQEGQMNFIYSYTSSDSIEKHGSSSPSEFGVIKIDLMSPIGGTAGALSYTEPFMPHQHLLLLMWSIVADILIIFGKYIKDLNRYFDIHAWTFLFLGISSLFLALIVKDSKYTLGGDDDDHDDHRILVLDNRFHSSLSYNERILAKSINDEFLHKKFALFTNVGTVIITIFGLWLRFAIAWSNKQEFLHKISIKYQRYLHTILSIILWVFARICLFTGTSMHKSKAGSTLYIYIIVETVIAIILFIILEVSYRLKFINNTVPMKPIPTLNGKQNSMNNEIMGKIIQKVDSSELRKQYPNKMIFIYLGRVYDLSNYIHPGGQWMFTEAAFTEVSRYLHGVSGMESHNSNAWKHSRVAFDKMEDNVIGELYEAGREIEWPLRDAKNGEVSNSQEKWTLEKRISLSKTTDSYEFRNEKFKVLLNLGGVAWIGKHYNVYGTNKARVYTTVNMMDSQIIQYRNYLLQVIENILEETDAKVDTVKYPESTDVLTLIIKKYNYPGALSKELAESLIGSQFKIEGPIGNGYGLGNDFKGNCVIIAVGTGILPFIDLLDLLFKKAMYMILKKEGKDHSIIKPEQDYDQIFPSSSFTLICSFRALKEFIGCEWICKLHNISFKFGLNLFRVVVRVKTDKNLNVPQTNEYFNTEFMKKQMNGAKYSKILICGTPRMMKDVSTIIIDNLNFDKDMIHFV